MLLLTGSTHHPPQASPPPRRAGEGMRMATMYTTCNRGFWLCPTACALWDAYLMLEAQHRFVDADRARSEYEAHFQHCHQ